MPIELPPTYISPYPETAVGGNGAFRGQDLSSGQSFPPGMQNPVATVLLQQGDMWCSPNCLAMFQDQTARDKFGIQSKVALKTLAAADQRVAEGRELRSSFNEIATDIGRSQQINEYIIKYPQPNRVFSGGMMTPFHALAHGMFGLGAPVSFPIQNVGLNVDIRSIPDVMNSIQVARPVGRSSLDVSFAYDVGKDTTSSWLTLGNITLRLVGEIDKSSSGAWTFNGEIRAYNDVYDANPSNHRGWLGENLTSILSEFPFTSYQIEIPGSLPVTIGGN
ncbi:lipid II-degrading bacteriocin [Pseudomonas syringae]|uniref:Lipid II-degrading bacteriocin n=1 Tax=Pseudomonas syringae CC1417 TaxID=1357272 RepID=A0AAU8LEJ0_PSESX